MAIRPATLEELKRINQGGPSIISLNRRGNNYAKPQTTSSKEKQAQKEQTEKSQKLEREDSVYPINRDNEF